MFSLIFLLFCFSLYEGRLGAFLDDPSHVRDWLNKDAKISSTKKLHSKLKRAVQVKRIRKNGREKKHVQSSHFQE